MEKLNQSGLLADQNAFFDNLIERYGSHLTKKEIAEMVFSKRCNKLITFRERKSTFPNLDDEIMRGNDLSRKALVEMNETLLDMGYPNKQKARININEEYSPDDDEKDVYLDVTVEFIRNLSSNKFDEEPNNYEGFIMLND